MTQMTSASEHLDPDMLSAFIDGELADGERQGIREHLAVCNRCTLRVLAATQLKAATARAGHRFAPPPDALGRLTLQLHAKPKATARIYTMRGAAWAVAAMLLLAVTLLGWRQTHQVNGLDAELLDQHLATLSSGAAPQVLSTDRHTVKPWFQGRLPFSFNIPDADALAPDTTLKGADLTYLDNQPAALLLFTIHKHQVSVFVSQRGDDRVVASLPVSRAGFAIRFATTQNLRIVAVSDVNPADLELLVSALAHAQSPS